MALRLLVGFVLLGAALPAPLAAQARWNPVAGYHSSAELARAIDSLARSYPALVQQSEIARSPGNRPVTLIRLGAGSNVDERPAVLVVANAHGPHLVGTEIVLRAIRDLAIRYGSDSTVARLLNRVTFYLVPRANPDAAEALFGSAAVERLGNDLATDDDRDDAVNEDGPEDLNGDGLITQIRVTDPAGGWIADPLSPELMRRADPIKGEVGRYQIWSEGIDNDGDQQVNEDGPGGIDVGRNFTHNYEWFTAGSGEHPIGTPESRALADLFRNHPNIAAVYVLGLQDNLSKLWEMKRVPGIAGNPQGTSAGGPFTAALPEDEPWYTEVSKRFKKDTGASEVPPTADFRGDFVSFSYFAMGRFAFGSRGWWIPKAPADTGKGASKPDQPDPIAGERSALAWLKAHRPEAVLAWRPVTAQGFDGKQVEVGGFAPGALLNPPAALLDSVATKQTAFLADLGGLLPSLTLRQTRVESLGSRVYRISAQLANEGYLPTMSAIGARVRWPRRVRVDLVLGKNQLLSSGSATQLLAPMSGSGTGVDLSWVVVGDPGSTVTIKAASPIAGSATQTLTLSPR
jgi:hypothetical protein